MKKIQFYHDGIHYHADVFKDPNSVERVFMFTNITPDNKGLTQFEYSFEDYKVICIDNFKNEAVIAAKDYIEQCLSDK